MKKILLILLLILPATIDGNAQPGPVIAVIENAVTEAVESPRMSDGHFYAKCDIERRWLHAFFNNHPVLSLVAVDDTPKWYQFWRKRGVYGFWFDLKTGSDLGLTSQLDKKLLTAMRRALLYPHKSIVGQGDDTVTYCLLVHSPYSPERFDRWLEIQRDIEVPWIRREATGTITFAFVTLEHSASFRRKNHSEDFERATHDAKRPMASYLVDFDWFNKANFLVECENIVFSDSLFSSSDAQGITTTIVKRYDQLSVWENGFYRGTYSLLRLPHLTSHWKDLASEQSAVGNTARVKSIRVLPFDEKIHRDLLARYEDSLFSRHLTAIDSSGIPDRKLLEDYFRIYGKYGTAHTRQIEKSIFDLARHSMTWGSYYLQTYNQRQGRWYDSIDDVSFNIVLNDFSQAQTYRNLFPLGHHLQHADEIITFQKACRIYDPNIYLAKYPSGHYADRFDSYFAQEEQRLYREASRIYLQDDASDIEATLRNAVSPYLQHFPKGANFREVNEMYYYGVAVQRRNALLYGSHYSMRTPRGRRLSQVIANANPGTTSSKNFATDWANAPVPTQQHTPLSSGSADTPPTAPSPISSPKQQLLHERLLAMPVSQYIDYHLSPEGGFQVTAIHIELRGKKGRKCHYEQPYPLTVSYDSSSETFFIDTPDGRRHESDTLFKTIKLRITDGYDLQQGTLYEIEQWFLENCKDLPSKK